MLWLPAAFAAPRFMADEPGLPELATAAWDAAVACTGREARAYPTVVIDVGPVRGGFAGRAYSLPPTTRTTGATDFSQTIDARGMFLIRLRSLSPATVAHEVAHAWVHAGPSTLVEGATDLLADCIAERDPKRFPRVVRPPGGLGALEELHTWTNPDAAVGRTEGYAAAYGLMVEVARLTPREGLWRERWDWPTFNALLATLGPDGAVIQGAVDGGVGKQRRFLGDLDGDGLTGAEELRAGTDPLEVDTDGDGWRDGYSSLLPEGLRVDGGVPTCLGLAAGTGGAAIKVTALDGGGKTQSAYVLADGERLRDAPNVPGGASLALTAGSRVWVGAGGRNLVPDDRCWSDGRWFVLADRAYAEDLAAFRAALTRADARALGELGTGGGGRVHLGKPPRSAHTPALDVIPGHIDWAREHGWDYIAALVVARARLADPAGPVEGADSATAEALARSLAPSVDGSEPLLALEEADVTAWEERARACGGWRAVLSGACSR